MECRPVRERPGADRVTVGCGRGECGSVQGLKLCAKLQSGDAIGFNQPGASRIGCAGEIAPGRVKVWDQFGWQLDGAKNQLDRQFRINGLFQPVTELTGGQIGCFELFLQGQFVPPLLRSSVGCTFHASLGLVTAYYTPVSGHPCKSMKGGSQHVTKLLC